MFCEVPGLALHLIKTLLAIDIRFDFLFTTKSEKVTFCKQAESCHI